MWIFAVWIGCSGRGHNNSGFLAFCYDIFCTAFHGVKGDEVATLWFGPLTDAKTAKFSFQDLFYCFKFWTDDIGMFSHMLYHSVNILEETYMTQLVYFVMADGLVL